MTNVRLLLVLAALAAAAPPAPAQNPISSKVVGSQVARRNRKLLRKFRARVAAENVRTSTAADSVQRADSVQHADSVRRVGGATGARPPRRSRPLERVIRQFGPRAAAEQRIAASEVAAYLDATAAAAPDTGAATAARAAPASCVGQVLGARPGAPNVAPNVAPNAAADTVEALSAVRQLERLCASPELEAVVPEALRIALADAYAAYRSRNRRVKAYMQFLVGMDGAGLSTSSPVVERIAAAALDRVLDVVERGHTNPQRWYLGGQLGLRLVGDGDAGIAARASARAAYFVPISPFQPFQLPIVTNLTEVAAARGEDAQAKLRKLATPSEGAFLSIEPTWDPLAFGPFKDARVQPFAAIGGQLNTLRDRADTKDVQFAQGRFGLGTNVEFGTPGPGRPILFFTARTVWRVYSPGASQQVFGTRNRGTPVIESFALVPIGGGMSVLAEVSTARHTRPVVRFALWGQATPQTATGRTDAGGP